VVAVRRFHSRQQAGRFSRPGPPSKACSERMLTDQRPLFRSTGITATRLWSLICELPPADIYPENYSERLYNA